MRKLLFALPLVLLVLAGCQAISDATGTSIEERCIGYKVALSRLQARADAGEIKQTTADDFAATVEAVCGTPE